MKLIQHICVAWDVFREIIPNIKRNLDTRKGRRGQWSNSVRAGAKALGTPAEEIEELLFLFSNPAFERVSGLHPMILEIRHSINCIKLQLDELNLLSQAENNNDPERQCYALMEIGLRSGEYIIPRLEYISNGLNYKDSIRSAADDAIATIRQRLDTKIMQQPK